MFCHAFAKIHKFKFANAELFLPESNQASNAEEQSQNSLKANGAQTDSGAAKVNDSDDVELVKVELELADLSLDNMHIGR